MLKIIHLSFYNLLVGRILHGIGAGILGFCFSKSTNESIPQHVLQSYGLLINSSFDFGFMIVGFFSLIVPDNDAHLEIR